jgi:hypothetical protein
MRRVALAASLVLLGLTSFEGSVDARPRRGAGTPASVCGVKVLPLAVGNTWTYKTIPAPFPPAPEVARLAPLQPKEIVVTVTSIERKDGDTVVTLEEKLTYDTSQEPTKPKLVEHKLTSTITCNNKGKFDISPEAFFFNGEPGGSHGLTFETFERKKETSWKLTKGTVGDQEWIEEIVATFKRTPAKAGSAELSGGKLELERRVTPQEPEEVTTNVGSWRSEKLGITTTGRVTLDKRLAPEGKSCISYRYTPDPKDPSKQIAEKVPVEQCELPANWISQIWLAEGVGVVQTLNMYAHMYQLVDMKLAK